MGLLIVIILIIAALTGTLWGVLKIAAGVALGIFLATALVATAAFLLLRSRVRRFQRGVDERLRGLRGPDDYRS
jgi:membrane protein implicated in regulation of membrane protease activity